MNTTIIDQYGIETSICVKDTFFNISEKNDSIRVCGHVEVISNNYLTCLLPIGVVCELIDHSNRVLEYQTWHPPPITVFMAIPFLESILREFPTWLIGMI